MFKIIQTKRNPGCPECPFYVLMSNNRLDCLFKNLSEDKFLNNGEPINPVAHLYNKLQKDPEKHGISRDLWEKDCTGQFKKCAFMPGLYDEAVDNDHLTNDELEDYNPFADYPDPLAGKNFKVAAFLVKSYYHINADALVYPGNNMLQILDHNFNQITENKLQQQLDVLLDKNTKVDVGRSILLNADSCSKLPVQKVFYAILGSPSALVTTANIDKCIAKSLLLAEAQKCKKVLIMPMDGGTLNIHNAVQAQFTAVLKYFENKEHTPIENIFFLTTNQTAKEIFDETYQRVFKRPNPANKNKNDNQG